MQRSVRSRLGLLLGGALVALLAAEAVLRLFPSLTDVPADVAVDYPVVSPAVATWAPYGLAPGSTFHAQYDGDPYGTLPPGATVSYRTNEVGFRGPPLDQRPREAGPRVVVIGDSFTFGDGVAEGDRFTDVLARRLGAAVEVVNLGVPGYASTDEVHVARRLLPKLRPEVTVLAYCLNDPLALAEDAYQARLGFDLINISDDVLRRNDRARLVASSSPSRLLDAVRNHVRSRRLTHHTVAWYRSMYEGPDAPWTRSRESVLDMARAARQNGSEFLLVILPIFVRTGGSGYPFLGVHETVSAWCEAENLPVLDTLPHFRGLDTRRLVVHPKDLHPNAAAHEVLGDVIADRLRPLLPGR
jgi:lysophospholipase L1-like esterase